MENEVLNDTSGAPAKKRRKIVAILLILVLLVGAGAGIFFLKSHVSYGAEAKVSDFVSLKKAVESTTTTRKIIIKKDIQMDGTITVPVGAEVQITDDGTVHTLQRSYSSTGAFFSVPENATLSITGSRDHALVLDGNSAGMAADLNGSLILNEDGIVNLKSITLCSNKMVDAVGGLVRSVGGEVTLDSCLLQGGSSRYGGAVYAMECRMELKNCTVTDNVTTIGHGGAVFGDAESEIILTDCTFTKNKAIGNGTFYGGAVGLSNYTKCTVTDCVFDGNSVEHVGTANGGAVFVGSGSTLNVTGKTQFKNNLAKGTELSLGGVIYANTGCTVNIEGQVTFEKNNGSHGGALYGFEATIKVDGATFLDNHSSVGHGGAIYMYQKASLELVNCTFTKNSADGKGTVFGGAVAMAESTGTINSCVFDGNYLDHEGNANGGALYVGTGSTMDITGATEFKNNSAKGTKLGLGGAIYTNADCKVTIGKGASFVGNTGTHGGAIYLLKTALVTVYGASFEDNHSTVGHGGAVYAYNGGTINLSGSTFTKNSADAAGTAYGGAVAIATQAKGSINSCVFDGNYLKHDGNANGGALYVGVNSTLSVSGNTQFNNNYVQGSKLSLGAALYANENSIVNIRKGASFTGNTSGHGGAIYVLTGATVNVSGATFTDNHSTVGHGGAVYAYNGGVINLSDSTFSKNSADAAGTAYGGAVAIATKAKGTISSCVFDGNYLKHEGNANGGALYVGVDSTLDVSGNTQFNNNYVQGSKLSLGAALYANENSVVNISTGASFTGNTSGHGGAIYVLTGATVNVSGATFTDNHSTVGHGGAVYAYSGGTINLSGSTFSKNSADAGGTAYGGAVAIATKAKGSISSCVFDGNYLKHEGNANGGALYVGVDSTLDVSGNTQFNNNYVQGSKLSLGAALYANENSVVNISTGASFTGNTSGHGGAIYVLTGATVNVSGATFTDNHSTVGHGGAIYAYDTGKVILKNSTFTKNSANGSGTVFGGAVAIATNASGAIDSCVFDGNYLKHEGNANGGAVYVGVGSTLGVTGSTQFKNNTAAGSETSMGGAIYTNNGSVLTIGSGATFTGNTAKSGGALGIVGADVTIDGAIFTNNRANAGSGGAIVTGDNTGFTTGLTIKGSSLTDNQASTLGGAVYDNHTGNLSISDTSLNGNSAASENQANALYMSDAKTVVLHNVTVTPAQADVADVNIGANSTLSVSGKIQIGRVVYAAPTSMIRITDALSSDSTATLIPSVYENAAVVAVGSEEQLFGIGGKFAVFSTDGKTWYVDDNGKLIDRSFCARVNDTPYEFFADALAAAGNGDTLTLLCDISLSDDTTIPAGVTMLSEGKAITMAANKALTLGANVVMRQAKVSGNIVVPEIGVDLTDTTVSGTVSAAAAVQVGGDFTADEIHLQTGASVNVATALTATGRAFQLTSDVESVNTCLVTAPDSDAIKAAVEHINGVFSDIGVALGDSGLIIQEPHVAFITKNSVTTKFSTLEDAITAADADDTIVLLKAAMVNATIQIDKTVVIDGGSNLVLSRGTELAGPVLQIAETGNLTLTNLTVSGTRDVVVDGQPLVRNEGTFTLAADATISGGNSGNNTEVSNGRHAGGLYNAGTAIISGTIADCTGRSGGAIYNASIADDATAVDGVLTITDGAVFNANISNAHGGAVYTRGGMLTVGKATFTNNTANGNGGAIEMVNPTAATFTNTIFDGNQAAATGNGGTICADTKQVVILTGVQIENSTGSALGGAIYNRSQMSLGEGVTIENCQANSGGAIYNINAALTSQGNVSIKNCNATEAGAIYNINGGTLTLGAGMVIDGCKANTAGAITNYIGDGFTSASVTLTGVEIKNCQATTSAGGAIWAKAKTTAMTSTVTLQEGTSIHDCSSKTTGGAIYNFTGTLVTTGNVSIANCSGSEGGAIYSRFNSTATLGQGLVIDGCTATSSGGAITNYDFVTLNADGVEIANCSGANGGAIWSSFSTTAGASASITLNRVNFHDNVAIGSSGYGGAISVIKGTLRVTDSVFKANRATVAQGGAIYIAAAGNATISSGSFTDNEAKKAGGAIYNLGGLSVENAVMTGNKSTADAGGALSCNYAGTTSITNCTITENTSYNYGGGAIYIGGKATYHLKITGGTLTGNSVQKAAYNADVTVGAGANLQLEGAPVIGTVAKRSSTSVISGSTSGINVITTP